MGTRIWLGRLLESLLARTELGMGFAVPVLRSVFGLAAVWVLPAPGRWLQLRRSL
jgi:thiol:disulfide interchange protein